MSTTINVNNASFLAGQSPFNWYNNGSTSSTTINEGAYFKIRFTGTSFGVTFDVSAMSGAGYSAVYYPTIKWQIDGGAATRQQLTSSDTTVTLGTGLSDALHSIVFWLDGIDEGTNTNRWDGTLSLVITALILDTGKTVQAYPKSTVGNGIVFSDSIGSGSVALALQQSSNYSIVQAASLGWQALCMDQLNVEYGNVSFCGQGYETGIQGMGAVTGTYNLFFTGHSRTLTPAPNVAMIQFGTNGGLSDPAILTTFLGNIRTYVGAACRIYLLIPFNQNAVSNITTGYNDYVTANPSDIITKIDLGSGGAAIVTANSYDTVHPNTMGYYLLAQAVYPLLAQVSKPGRPSTGAFSASL